MFCFQLLGEGCRGLEIMQENIATHMEKNEAHL